eukprot:4722013-Prymnesium_polylepis.1
MGVYGGGHAGHGAQPPRVLAVRRLTPARVTRVRKYTGKSTRVAAVVTGTAVGPRSTAVLVTYSPRSVWSGVYAEPSGGCDAVLVKGCFPCYVDRFDPPA